MREGQGDSAAAPIEVREILPEATHPLRQAVLRPHQQADQLVYPGDDAESTIHFGACAGEALVGIASLYHESCAEYPGDQSWRLRGMAVAAEWRNQGIGALLLKACMQRAAAAGGRHFWCHARLTARNFYLQHGLEE